MNTTKFRARNQLAVIALLASVGAAAERPHWNNIEVIRENVEAPRAHFTPCPDRACADNPWRQSLDGLWKFHYADSPTARPADFFEPGFDVSAWADLPVPSNWERHGHGYPIYVNVPYPFEIDEPDVPTEHNPVGSYRRDFAVPASWDGRDVFIEFGAVSSAFYLWVNGEYVGYSEGSKTASEFDLTRFVRPGANTVAVEVYRWSTGSYLEDQDFWSLSGIQRSVHLTARPQARVRDYFVYAGLSNDYADGAFAVDIELHNGGEPRSFSLAVTVLDGNEPIISSSGEIELVTGASQHRFEGAIPGVRQWSAEIPNLYTLVIEAGEEVITQPIGFRTSEIKNGRYHVNGRLVKLKGVNLHEHHDVTGHVVDEATMRTDIRLMKGANMNAVRNSHYPQPERWYELTSEHGLYVVDEANIESHGYGYDHDKTLGNKPHWMEHHLDRTRRMFHRAKNFPSVVIWSLGNEAGDGVNLGATYRWLKAADASRPVQYETEGDISLVGERHSDFHSSMYWRHWDLEAYAQTHNDRPFVLIEYAHSMGNSTGNLKEYWDVINAHDILAGGFIWDWVDQGLREVDEDGNVYWTYGGDYGPPDVPSSGNFCANGIVFSDRRVQPAYWEVKRAYQEVEFELLDAVRGEIRISNNYDFLDLKGFVIRWIGRLNGGPLMHRYIDAPTLAPGKSTVLRLWDNFWAELDYWEELPDGLPPANFAGNVIHLDLELLRETPRLETGPEAGGNDNLLAQAQFPIPNPWGDQITRDLSSSEASMLESPDLLAIKLPKATFTMDRNSGLLTSIRAGTDELLLNPLRPEFWRAPTDNDFGNYMDDWAGVWRDATGNRVLESLETGHGEKGQPRISATYVFHDVQGRPVARWTAHYSAYGDDGLHVVNEISRGEHLPEIPRIGMNLELAPLWDTVNWAGRGPHENYSDRRHSAHYGNWRLPIGDMYVPYMRPQENGNRTGVRVVGLYNQNELGWDRKSLSLWFGADDRFDFSVLRNRMQDFIPPVKIAITSEDGEGARKNEDRVNMHVNDIKPRELIAVDIDYGQMGLGGDDSWGKKTLQAYMLSELEYRYGFTISVVDKR